MEYLKNITGKASLWENMLREGGLLLSLFPSFCHHFSPDTVRESGPPRLSLAERSGTASLQHLHVAKAFKFFSVSVTLKTWLTSVTLLELYDFS